MFGLADGENINKTNSVWVMFWCHWTSTATISKRLESNEELNNAGYLTQTGHSTAHKKPKVSSDLPNTTTCVNRTSDKARPTLGARVFHFFFFVIRDSSRMCYFYFIQGISRMDLYTIQYNTIFFI